MIKLIGLHRQRTWRSKDPISFRGNISRDGTFSVIACKKCESFYLLNTEATSFVNFNAKCVTCHSRDILDWTSYVPLTDEGLTSFDSEPSFE